MSSGNPSFFRPAVSVALAGLLLASCSVGPDYRAPATGFLDRWFSSGQQEIFQADQIVSDWWSLFSDPQLESYIQGAVAGNNDIKAARANVIRARALRREAIAPFFPEVNGDFSRTRQGTSGTTASTFSGGARRTIYDGGFDASWEIDIFGGTRRADEASQARLDGAEDENRAVVLAVIAETARSYFEARGIQKRIEIFEQNIALQEKTYRLVEDLYKTGEASEFDLSRARGQLELTRSRLPDLEAEMKAAIFRLSVLQGRPPEALLGEMGQSAILPLPPDFVPLGLRSDILRRRPDVRAAERELAAATADIGVAIADLYPQFSLTGNIGRSASVFSDLFDPGSNVFSVGQILQWPIFQGGAIRANIKVQEAEAHQATARYEQSVLDSLADAETALTRYLQKRITSRRVAESVDSLRRAASLARVLFEAGEENFLSVLDAERELSAAEDEKVRAETDVILNLVGLYSALGGGWELFERAPEPHVPRSDTGP